MNIILQAIGASWKEKVDVRHLILLSSSQLNIDNEASVFFNALSVWSLSMNDKTKDWKRIREEQDMHEGQDETVFDGPDDELVNESIEDEQSTSALEHPSYKALEDQLTQAEQKAHEHWEKSVRALAELDNVRRRAERDVENAHRYGLEKFINALLPVIDSLEQALQLAEQETDSAMREGLELTMKLFLDVLQKYDVKQLNPEGEVFDPTHHEAMSMQASDDCAPNTVLVVFQKGYMLNERVIRPARVIVSKGTSS